MTTKFNSNDKQILLSSPLQTDSVVDGPGIRTVVWTQGCIHNCPGCHNPETHSLTSGQLVDISEICDQIKSNKQNITFSGGDPMLQAKQCACIAKFAKNLGLTVWVYTGFTFEYLMSLNDTDINNFTENIDVLVDGRFDIKRKSLECQYRGSTNQRLIDVPSSIKCRTVVLWHDPYKSLETASPNNLF